MSLNSDIMRVMNGLGFPNDVIAPSLYLGGALEYVVFQYDVRPVSWADDVAGDVEFNIQIHYCAPWEKNTYRTRALIRNAIEAEWGDFPDEVDASDGDTQHFVYDFSIIKDKTYGTE